MVQWNKVIVILFGLLIKILSTNIICNGDFENYILKMIGMDSSKKNEIYSFIENDCWSRRPLYESDTLLFYEVKKLNTPPFVSSSQVVDLLSSGNLHSLCQKVILLRNC